MLDNDGSGLGEFLDEFESAVQVDEVVIAEFLAVQLLGGGGAGLIDLGFLVEGGRLVGVLAVAETLDLAVAEGFRFAEHRGVRAHGVG